MSAPLSDPQNSALRALVLDERAEIRERIRRLLAEAGIHSYELSTTLGSTSIMTRRNIDVVIVGPELAGKNATRFVQMLRNNPSRAHLKVVLLVGEAGELEHEADVVLEERDLERSLISVVRSIGRSSAEYLRS